MNKISLAIRLIILQEIFENFQHITQDLTWNPESVSKYHYRSESLIELLEADDCGSVGGYDLKNPAALPRTIGYMGACYPRVSGYSLYDRFLFLLKKFDQESKIIKDCNFTPAKLAEYFKKVTLVREKM